MNRFNIFQVRWNKKSQHLCVCACFVSSSRLVPLPENIFLVWPERAVSLGGERCLRCSPVSLGCTRRSESQGRDYTVYVRYAESHSKPCVEGHLYCSSQWQRCCLERKISEWVWRVWEAHGWDCRESWWLGTSSSCRSRTRAKEILC